MSDSGQVISLRRMREGGGRGGNSGDGAQRARALAVTGAKGGVGKSSIALNLAIAYAQRDSRTLLVDADLGMADQNLLLGVAPERSLLDVVLGMPVDQALVPAHGIHLLPALNGCFQLESLDHTARERLLDRIDSLRPRFDTLVVDIGAGIGPTQTHFAGAVPSVVIVANPEPLSLADAYACLKVLALRSKLKRAYVLPNRVHSQAGADEVSSRLTTLVRRFLNMELVVLPAIPFDPQVGEAAAEGVPLLLSRPDAPASRAIRAVARRLDALAVAEDGLSDGHLLRRAAERSARETAP